LIITERIAQRTNWNIDCGSALNLYYSYRVFPPKQQNAAECSRIATWISARRSSMQLVHIKNIASDVVRAVDEKHIMVFAAALSYYFVLSVFPLLIFVSAVIAYLPVSSLFNQIVGVLASVVPPESIGMVRNILAQVLLSRHGGLLTFGIVFTIWSASSGFAAMIEALNVTYGVPETRRIWTTRALAIGFTFLVGILLVVALGVLIAGPTLGEWLARKVGLSPEFIDIWPYIRWSLATGASVIAVELLYVWAPNVRQKFLRTLPGAVIAVGGWISLSYFLGIYFRHFANYKAMYGTLGAAIAFSVWVYWTNFVILMGATINAKLLQEAGEASLLMKDRRRTVAPKRPRKTDLAA
jgi:membrane protein